MYCTSVTEGIYIDFQVIVLKVGHEFAQSLHAVCTEFAQSLHIVTGKQIGRAHV